MGELTSRQVVDKLKSADIVGKESNESGRQVQRYIRLTELPQKLINAVDSKKMSFNVGVELSYLNENEKIAVEVAATEIRRFPTLAQAKKIRELATGVDEVTADGVAIVLMEKERNEDDDSINFDRADIRAFFPKNFAAWQIEEAIVELLRERKALQQM